MELIDNDVDVNVKNRELNTVLHYAAANGKPRIYFDS